MVGLGFCSFEVFAREATSDAGSSSPAIIVLIIPN